MKSKLIEIFSSIQGEGLWIGKPQVFVRFKGCRLQCSYCDTPLTHAAIFQSRVEKKPFSGIFQSQPLEYTVDQLNCELQNFSVRSLALTGGEPLEQVDFLQEWLPTLNGYEILLETSGIEVAAYEKIASFISITSMDIKIPSATKEKPCWDLHYQFLKLTAKKSCYVKIVYDENLLLEEKKEIAALIDAYPPVIFIFQPVSPLRQRNLKICFNHFDYFSKNFSQQVRLIPQVHKFLSIL
ncbi:MAG: hypothetical protein A3G32_09465 [Deltaproteobacteria bacterium RIFCSPLOWO2_12_FULL_40_28]|nr:MAG: hypothetical protein A3C45_07735 [Deltaproteobacteria bacterium RIFCSPHIGHO2_02_FULL_40_28]OGQ20511.1 MAG: hypothetical protein A3E27_02525 [Deltaproteobacteria bacterium RIFCSPHIGHO2_12_FULL_40_32]OGQ41162.1 MAG: hypothetical protein A3I69_07760 [Deltaproteobacteria bacterium RIFCSPLOWO2_02_FULL_40_36]OGQ55124.1 MAG: hypothetical protein A3G32_09465 [Deltaproteobacteria bacterium RIFCSPLOWO2_12_FULL_40_28]